MVAYLFVIVAVVRIAWIVAVPTLDPKPRRQRGSVRGAYTYTIDGRSFEVGPGTRL